MLQSIKHRARDAFIRHSLSVAYNFPLIRVVSSCRPVVLLYHGVPASGDGTGVDGNAFEKHILFLKKYCHFVTPDSLETTRRPLDKSRVLLTFDDGFRNNAAVVAPILRRHKVPALFFVCSRHAVPGKYLWFVYMHTLKKYFHGNGFTFRGEFIDMCRAYRHASVQRLSAFLRHLTPHPSAMYRVIEEELPPLEDFVDQKILNDCCAGMTAEQVGELATDPLFTLGAHTVDHPFLTQCEPQEALQQIQQNKNWLEQLCNKPCHTIAYPSGDYDSEVLQHAHRLGFMHGYAVDQHVKHDLPMEIPRIGIYATSVDILGFKVQWGNWMRALGIKIG